MPKRKHSQLQQQQHVTTNEAALLLLHPQRSSSSSNKIKKYSGVYLTKSGNFSCQIRIDNKNYNPGTFKTPKEAAEAYDRAAMKAGRPTSKLNFPNHVQAKNYKPKKKKLYRSNTIGFRKIIIFFISLYCPILFITFEKLLRYL